MEAKYHIITDIACRVLHFGTEIAVATPGEDTSILLAKGRHLLSFVSDENSEDSYKVLFEVPENDIEDFIEVSLSRYRDARISKEEEKRRKTQEEIEKQKRIERENERMARARLEAEERHRKERERLEEYKSNFIDLGLSVIWADSNLEGIYPWGETKAGGIPWRINYKYFQGMKHGHPDFNPDVIESILKYNRHDGLVELTLDDDAAFQTLGKGYHIPTKDQWHELFIYCEKTVERNRDQLGVRFSSRKSGYEGQSIFIPIQKWLDPDHDRYNPTWIQNGYWSSTRYGHEQFAFCAAIGKQCLIKHLSRENALMIRPVRDI